MSALPSNFDTLPPLEKRAAMERATGLSWDEYAKLPGETKVAILSQLKGDTYLGGVNDMLAAAQRDSTANRLAGYWGGFTGATKLLLLAAIIGLAWLILPTLGKNLYSVRKAVA